MINRKLLKQFSILATKIDVKYYSLSWTPLALKFNTRPTTKFSFSLLRHNVGLFEVPELCTHKGFDSLKQQCIEDTDRLLGEAISKNRQRKMVEIFDELSDSICKVADLAEFIRLAHPNAQYTLAAETVCAALSGVVEKLNTHRELYLALKNAVEKGDKFPTTNLDNHVGRLFLFDFEQSGIHLPDKERNMVVNLNDKILHLGQSFVAGANLPRRMKKSLLSPSIRNLFVNDEESVLVSGLYADSSDPIAREMAYRIFLYPDEQQDQLLTELLQCRNELARVCGFKTYAQRALRGSTVETPEMVTEFLDLLTKDLKSRADEDFKIMSKMKQYENPSSGPLAPWDIAYFTKKAKKRWFHVTSSEYSPYFSLGACMEGINVLFQNLYKVTLVDVQMKPGESWAADVYKLAVMHEQEGLLGYIYCDFYEREGKSNQDCHFTIQGGRVLPNGDYQLPIVVLMLNLALPRWSTPSLLTPHMVDNLFHEMGHAMHSMLGRTRYQHVTGTRCSTDFAEVPSILMEYFASDPRVLRKFARHFQTKEVMPEDMLRRLLDSKRVFSASEMQVQVFYSALDQTYHGTHPLPGTTTDVLALMQGKYYSLPYVENTTWQLHFSHLVGYGAKYYSYIVSRALASWIWHTYFEADPLSHTQGERYRNECLAHGGGKPSKQLVADFLQRELTPALMAESIVKEIDEHRLKLENISDISNLM